MKLKLIISIGILLTIITWPKIGKAATITVPGEEIRPPVGQTFSVPIYFDSQGEEINAIEGSLSYPKDLLELQAISEADSIINFWVASPNSDQPKFSGVIAGGYSGSKGLIFTLTFKALKEGQGTLTATDLKFLKNDGLATQAPASATGLVVFVQGILQNPVTSSTPAALDQTPPQPFTPEVAKAPDLFNDKWFVVFQTQDQESGIDHYEVAEIFAGTPKNSDWSRQSSPYVLKDQARGSYIFVKAVDRAGNSRVEKILPQEGSLWYEKFAKWVIISLSILAVAVLLYLALKLRKKAS